MAKNMKIAILSFYSGLENRGVETLVRELSKRLVKKHKIFVFQAGKKPNQKYKTVKLQSPWRPGHSGGILRKLFLDFYSLSILQFTLRCFPHFLREKFDIIFPLSNGWQSFLCKLYCLFSKSRLIISGQSGLGWDDRVNLLLNPDAFVALTDENKRWAKSVNSKAKITKIPNGVDLKSFHPQVKPEKVKLKRPLIISLSALASSKRLNLAIKAVARLRNTSLLILGEGHLKKDLQKLGDEFLGKERFKILSCSHQEVPSYLSAAKAFTLPSIPQESFGIATVEAMAVNLPVVVTDDPSRKEIIGNAGLLVDPENVTLYSQKLKKALEANWDNKPRTQAQKFSWDKIAQDYEKLFLKLISQ